MVDIIREFSELAERGPIVISMIALGSILLLIKWVLPIIRESSANNAKLSESNAALAGALDRKTERDSKLEVLIVNACAKIENVTDGIDVFSKTLQRHDRTLDDHENRIQILEFGDDDETEEGGDADDDEPS